MGALVLGSTGGWWQRSHFPGGLGKRQEAARGYLWGAEAKSPASRERKRKRKRKGKGEICRDWWGVTGWGRRWGDRWRDGWGDGWGGGRGWCLTPRLLERKHQRSRPRRLRGKARRYNFRSLTLTDSHPNRNIKRWPFGDHRLGRVNQVQVAPPWSHSPAAPAHPAKGPLSECSRTLHLGAKVHFGIMSSLRIMSMVMAGLFTHEVLVLRIIPLPFVLNISRPCLSVTSIANFLDSFNLLMYDACFHCEFYLLTLL